MNTPLSAPSEMVFFSLLARCGSFSATARELNVTTPAVSKRLAQMETRLGVQLVNRTTRRMSLTPEGELYLAQARRILGVPFDPAQPVATPAGLKMDDAAVAAKVGGVTPLPNCCCQARKSAPLTLPSLLKSASFVVVAVANVPGVPRSPPG